LIASGSNSTISTRPDIGKLMEEWQTYPPQATYSLRAGEVHVWQVDMDDAASDHLIAVLSKDEQATAARFATSQLNLRYRRCRAALRALLARYTRQAPAALRFDYNPYGKPSLAGNLHFNVSHSGRQALIALAPHPVGIDIETLDRPSIDVASLTALTCHWRERAVLSMLNEDERKAHFFRLWTRKEAYCKALGVGLHHPMSAVFMRDLPGSTAALVVDELAIESPPYFAYTLPDIARHVASICLPCTHPRLCMYSLQGTD
jgi:4'-phosphopantetheinyl transferase